MKKLNDYKLVILDRDGVINQDSDAYIKSPQEWIAIEGSLETIARLHKQGIKIAIATNQSGIARGLLTEADLASIHEKMLAEIKTAGGVIDYIAYCTDHPDRATDRRKPGSGMLYEISKTLDISLSEAIFIGDKDSDRLAAQNAGCAYAMVTKETSIHDLI